MKTIKLFISIPMCLMAGVSYAEPPINYESQLIGLFGTLAHSHASEELGGSLTPEEGIKGRALLNDYFLKMNNHSLHMKNVVFRKDTNVIRITFADDDNQYVFKVAYKTNHDEVLSNSLYADKSQIIDIKFIYMEGGVLKYFRIQPQPGMNDAGGEHALRDGHENYILQFNLPNEQCGFCHELAKYDDSASGLFFPRYQERHSTRLVSAIGFFNEKSFALVNKSKVKHALPDGLSDEFWYQSVSYDKNLAQANVYARTLFELPELVEVMARDNRKNYCISVEFSSPVFSNDNYICADFDKKKLFVKFSNPMLTSGNKNVMYEKAFW